MSIDYYLKDADGVFPREMLGISSPNDDDTYTVFVHNSLSEKTYHDTLVHELRHIKGRHFELEMSVERMERQADGEHFNPALHPPEGELIHFNSLDALKEYLVELTNQTGGKLP